MTTDGKASAAATPNHKDDPTARWLFSLGPSFFMGSGFFCLTRAANATMLTAPQALWFVGALVLLRFWRMGDKTEQLARNLRQLEAAILTHDVIAETQRLARVPGARLSVKRRRPQIEYSILAE
jgi:hypothetical protein